MKITLNQAYSFCQIGQRDNQEDARFPNVDVPMNAAPYFVVCDGVGGREKGEVASSAVCDAFGKALAKTDWNEEFTTEKFEEALRFAYDSLDKADKKGKGGMATTMTFVAFHKGGVTMAHIGDSRIYQIRPGAGVIYISDDHSLVNALVHSGNITAEEAIDHPKSNYITRSMSAGQDRCAATLVLTTDVEPGDYFMLCSDGVLHNVDDGKLKEIFEKEISDAEKCKEIASLSEDSSDNNTAIIIGVADVEKEEFEKNEIVSESDSVDTVAFKRRTEMAVEVEVKKHGGIGDKISEFFKKLF